MQTVRYRAPSRARVPLGLGSGPPNWTPRVDVIEAQKRKSEELRWPIMQIGAYAAEKFLVYCNPFHMRILQFLAQHFILQIKPNLGRISFPQIIILLFD